MNEAELPKAEQAELRRLNGKHRDIRRDGNAVLERLAVKEELARRRQAFVDAHGLSCFKCGQTVGDWAAGGKNEWGKLWVICSTCVRKPRTKGAA
jgi:hypothetical protein